MPIINRLADWLKPDEPTEDVQCVGITVAARLTAEAIAAYGWCSHIVCDDSASPTGFNAHSHGLLEGFGHPDFQVVLPMPPRMAHAILLNLAERVKAGFSFEAGQETEGVLHGYAVSFAWASESGRDVLRVILPGPGGRLAREEIGNGYEVQYIGTGTAPCQ